MSKLEEKDQGAFKVIKITKLEDLQDSTVKELPESDLTIQSDTHLVQLEYVEQEHEKDKYLIKPGCFVIANTAIGTVLDKFELKKYDLLETIDNTSTILQEQQKFFDRLDVYKELNREPKRAVLLCSPPGVGKTAAINKVCETALKEEGTVIVLWDTGDVRANSVNKFFLNGSNFKSNVKRLIMVIEDIEGGTSEDDYSSKGVTSSLLNFLDGVGSPFKGIPTFIIATTNNPERSVGALIDRPGRFDKIIEMKTPSKDECLSLLRFIRKTDKETDQLELAAKLAADNEFSIAHLQEAVVRSMLDDISVKEAVDQLVKHKKRFKEAFAKAPQRKLGLGE